MTCYRCGRRPDEHETACAAAGWPPAALTRYEFAKLSSIPTPLLVGYAELTIAEQRGEMACAAVEAELRKRLER